MKKLTPCLWFDFNADEAIEFYLSIFEDGRVIDVSRYGDATPQLKGKTLVARFTMAGQEFLALNGGPQFPFTEAISMSVDCADQAEIDRLWNALLADGGKPSQCGWLKDRYGLSWQLVPTKMGEWLGSDPVRGKRVFDAMMPMQKLDIATLQAAFDGR